MKNSCFRASSHMKKEGKMDGFKRREEARG
jgi:hypothetical protein